MHAFLHAHNKLPKVLLLPAADGEDEEAEAPSWFTSAAMAFKDGRTKTVSFAYVPPKDVSKVALRFGGGITEYPALVGVSIEDGKAWLFSGGALGKGTAALKAAKEFATELKGGQLSDDSSMGLPAFPEPTRPRKQATASLEEFTHETLPLACYGKGAAGRPLCVLAVMDQKQGGGCADSMAELARMYRNDKTVAFGCVGAALQADFLSGLGLASTDLPALLAIKGAGKRPRAARMSGTPDDVTAMAAFVDGVLGGSATFKKLSDGLPELEPPYLLNAEEPKDEV